MIKTVLELIGIVGIAFFLGAVVAAKPEVPQEQPRVEPRAEQVELHASLPISEESKTDEVFSEDTEIPSQQPPVQPQKSRLSVLYESPPVPLEQIYSRARDALVNITCRSGASSSPISGSGVIIDSDGIVLTNAHVAQYVLLSMHPNIQLTCTVRAGSPARDIGGADMLYIPSQWIEEHARDIQNPRPLGTGERDYAFIAIRPENPQNFPFLPVDVRENIAITGDSVLLAAYPAELTTHNTVENLAVSSSLATVIKVLTFGSSSVDLISLRGVTVAQSGASGGAVVNEWGQLVGLISTKSAGETSVERDLRAITTSYINRSLSSDLGVGLHAFLNQDVSRETEAYGKTAAHLAEFLYNELK
jgi:S1-C subfamily serine protease